MNYMLKVEEPGDVTPIVQGLFDDWNGIPFPQFLGQKESYKNYSWWDVFAQDWMLFGSAVWWGSGFNTWEALFEYFGGAWDELSWFDAIIWWYYRVGQTSPGNYNFGVYSRNQAFLATRDLANQLAKTWFYVFFWWTFFITLTADGLLQFDFDEIDAKGWDYSIQQATAYHYWGTKETHDLGTLFWVGFWDYVSVVWFFPETIGALVYYAVYSLIEIVSVFLWPAVITIQLLTPWDEAEGEDAVMWWVDAIALGLYNPRDPPTNLWEIPEARTQYLNKMDFPPLEDEAAAEE